MLHNQELAIDAFEHKWQMAGSESQAFIRCTRSQSDDFIRCEMFAIERFQRLQKRYEGRMRDEVLTLQDECKDHVGDEEIKLRAELHNSLQHESTVFQTSAQQLSLRPASTTILQQEARVDDVLMRQALSAGETKEAEEERN